MQTTVQYTIPIRQDSPELTTTYVCWEQFVVWVWLPVRLASAAAVLGRVKEESKLMHQTKTRKHHWQFEHFSRFMFISSKSTVNPAS